MSDDEDVEQFETADSGASTTIPMQAGNVRKGGFMVIKGRPTKVNFRCFRRRKLSTEPFATIGRSVFRRTESYDLIDSQLKFE